MTLIEPAELAGRLAEVSVLDVRWNLAGPDGAEEFAAGHIPGARWVDLEAELTGPGGGRHPLPAVADFEAAMRRHGVGERPIVVTDQASSLAAARLWWMLTDLGRLDVAVLNGGFAAWRAAGFAVETGPAAAVEPGRYVAGAADWSAVDAAEVARATGAVFDVRAPERYRGETEPIDPVAGHVPGAQNLPSALHFQPDGRLRPAAELAQTLAPVRAGDIVYCGSGVTAAQTLLALAVAGRPGVRLYAGSWSDWISDPERPVETG